MLQVPRLQPSGGPAEVLHSLASVPRSGKRDCATALGIDSGQNAPLLCFHTSASCTATEPSRGLVQPVQYGRMP